MPNNITFSTGQTNSFNITNNPYNNIFSVQEIKNCGIAPSKSVNNIPDDSQMKQKAIITSRKTITKKYKGKNKINLSVQQLKSILKAEEYPEIASISKSPYFIQLFYLLGQDRPRNENSVDNAIAKKISNIFISLKEQYVNDPEKLEKEFMQAIKQQGLNKNDKSIKNYLMRCIGLPMFPRTEEEEDYYSLSAVQTRLTANSTYTDQDIKSIFRLKEKLSLSDTQLIKILDITPQQFDACLKRKKPSNTPQTKENESLEQFYQRLDNLITMNQNFLGSKLPSLSPLPEGEASAKQLETLKNILQVYQWPEAVLTNDNLNKIYLLLATNTHAENKLQKEQIRRITLAFIELINEYEKEPKFAFENFYEKTHLITKNFSPSLVDRPELFREMVLNNFVKFIGKPYLPMTQAEEQNYYSEEAIYERLKCHIQYTAQEKLIILDLNNQGVPNEQLAMLFNIPIRTLFSLKKAAKFTQ